MESHNDFKRHRAWMVRNLKPQSSRGHLRMNLKLMISAAALLLLSAVMTPVYAEGEQHENAQSRGQEHQEQRPAPRPQLSYGAAYHGGVRADGATHGGVHHSGVPQHAGQVHEGFMQSRAKSWSSEHRSWAQRGGYNGYRISDERFRMYFGHEHPFRIGRLPLVFVGGYPRFLYDGYWVTAMDPWPDSWPANWYENDDVYLDYSGDGYYLYDRNYPGIGIAVTVAF
jgi:hypothetical protein